MFKNRFDDAQLEKTKGGEPLGGPLFRRGQQQMLDLGLARFERTDEGLNITDALLPTEQYNACQDRSNGHRQEPDIPMEPPPRKALQGNDPEAHGSGSGPTLCERSKKQSAAEDASERFELFLETGFH